MKRIFSLLYTAILILTLCPGVFASEQAFEGFGDIAYSDKLRMFAAGAAKGTIYTSKNTTGWVRRFASGNAIGGNGAKGMIWSDTYEMFIALPTNKNIVTSTDGVNWNATDVSAYFATNINTITEKDGYLFVSDDSSNVYYTQSPRFDSWTKIEQSVKTAKTWRGATSFGGGIMYYSTVAWDGTANCMLVDTKTMKADEIRVKDVTVNRYYDMFYSKSMNKLLAVYCVAGNNYENSYVAIYDELNKTFVTNDTIVTSAVSITETDRYFLLPTINKAKIYSIEKSSMDGFASSDVTEVSVSGIDTSHRIYNIVTDGSRVVAVTSAKAVISMNESMDNIEVLGSAYLTPYETGIDVFAGQYTVIRNEASDHFVELTAYPADQSGIKMSDTPTPAVWEIESVSESSLADCFSVDNNGLLTIRPMSTEHDVSVTIKAVSGENSAYVTIVTKKAPVPTEIVITGAEQAVIPKTQHQSEYLYDI